MKQIVSTLIVLIVVLGARADNAKPPATKPVDRNLANAANLIAHELFVAFNAKPSDKLTSVQLVAYEEKRQKDMGKIADSLNGREFDIDAVLYDVVEKDGIVPILREGSELPHGVITEPLVAIIAIPLRDPPGSWKEKFQPWLKVPHGLVQEAYGPVSPTVIVLIGGEADLFKGWEKGKRRKMALKVESASVYIRPAVTTKDQTFDYMKEFRLVCSIPKKGD